MFTSHSAYSKAVADDSPLSPTQKPRGYGGVAILYSRTVNFTMKQLPVGGNRIIAVEVQSSPSLCICSVICQAGTPKTTPQTIMNIFWTN